MKSGMFRFGSTRDFSGTKSDIKNSSDIKRDNNNYSTANDLYILTTNDMKITMSTIIVIISIMV